MKRSINTLGAVVDDQNIVNKVLQSSEKFLSLLFERRIHTTNIELNYGEGNILPDVMYYLIYNRYVVVGKKKIDKRVVRLINKKEIMEELDMYWSPGLEPNFVLIPQDLNFHFGIYIQDGMYYLEWD